MKRPSQPARFFFFWEEKVKFKVTVEFRATLSAEIEATGANQVSAIAEALRIGAQLQPKDFKVTPDTRLAALKWEPLPYECGQKGCGKPATFTYVWPGQGEMGACDEHVAMARRISEAMGLTLQFNVVT